MITTGYLARHHMGKRGMAGPALLDVAQDYALQFLNEEGLFDLGVVLKGGTSLRKFRAGNAGRFSTDLDFAVPDEEVGELLMDTLDGATIHGVSFTVANRSALRGTIEIDTPLGRPNVPARIEASSRPLWLPTESIAPIALPVHAGYEFELPALPAPALEEALAEKLAAWRRRRKMRDLYDLYWFGRGPLNEALVRRILILKVWHDVVIDGLGTGPFDPITLVEQSNPSHLVPEDIGLLTQPVEPERWLAVVQNRYRFVLALDEVEAKLAQCDPRDRWQATQLAAKLPTL